MSKVIIQNKEKADIIKKLYHMQYKKCSSGYEFEYSNKFKQALIEIANTENEY